MGTTIVASGSAEACKLQATKASVRAQLDAPIIADRGFRATSPTQNRSQAERTHLWLQFSAVPASAHMVIFEPVWGAGPKSLRGMWGQALPLREGHVVVYPQTAGPHRDQAFTLGLRARFVSRDGSLSAPSTPVFITHQGSARSSDSLGADKAILAVCCLSLLGLWVTFRREREPVLRIRVAAAVGLVSLLFLSASPALPWMSVEDESGRLPAVDCHIGGEAECATYVPDAGPNPMSLSEVSSARRFELARWVGASTALRMGLILSLVLLMPTLIWLMVAPRLRPAQTAMALGASAAGYTLIAAILYRATVPSWMEVQATQALDLTIVTTVNILVATAMVVYWSYRDSCEAEGPNLPTAKTVSS